MTSDRPGYYAYVASRDERRTAAVAAADREARQGSWLPAAARSGYNACREAEAAFDEQEPLLDYEQWQAVNS